MNSRRLISAPRVRNAPYHTAGNVGGVVRHSKSASLLSERGHSRRFGRVRPMSALPPKATGIATCRAIAWCGKWCRRHIVAQWLDDCPGIEVQEVGFPNLDRFAYLEAWAFLRRGIAKRPAPLSDRPSTPLRVQTPSPRRAIILATVTTDIGYDNPVYRN